MSHNRRQLHFDDLPAALTECELLLSGGYRRGKNWSLGQICRHLTLAIHASIHGYPKWMSLFAPVRPVFRKFMLPSLLRGDSPAGLPTAPSLTPPAGIEDAAELMAYRKIVDEFLQFPGPCPPHPGFGIRDHGLTHRFHAAHAAHHLGFLIPAGESQDG